MQAFNNLPTNTIIPMLGWMVENLKKTKNKKTKITIVHTLLWAYLQKINER